MTNDIITDLIAAMAAARADGDGVPHHFSRARAARRGETSRHSNG